jgi:3-oxosteroid 1-dehydrogenase
MNGTASWNDHYDVVVARSGTGLLGAITAARRGLRDLVVEKGASFGGSTAMSVGGLWMPNSRVLQEAGILDT